MNFIKLHLLSHALEHVIRKGSLRDTSTKLGEHGHVQWKADYQRIRRGMDEERQVRVQLNESRDYFIYHRLVKSTRGKLR